MEHILLDTGIYTKDPNRAGPHFKAIEKLAKSHKLKLHAPYIVEREFQTQERKVCADALSKTKSGLSSLLKKRLPKETTKRLSACKAAIDALSECIPTDIEEEFSAWLEDLQANRFPLCIDQTNKALEAYFCGLPPLKTVKERKDIPDSFIARAIEKIISTQEKLHLIIEDNKLRDTFKNEPKVEIYKSLSLFVESDLAQGMLLDVDLLENLPGVIGKLRAFEEESKEIEYAIEKSIGDAVVGRTIRDYSIPDDNHEATIDMFHDPENIVLDFNSAFYVGDGQLGIPFTLDMEVQAYFYLYKGDYYTLEDPPSVTDHNDHYFEAEDDFPLYVEGIASASIDKSKLNTKDFTDCVLHASFGISEITAIEVANDAG